MAANRRHRDRGSFSFACRCKASDSAEGGDGKAYRANLSENREPGEDMQMRFEKPGKRNGRINGSSPFLVESAMFLYAFVQGMEKKGGEGMPLGNGGRKSGVTAPRQ